MTNKRTRSKLAEPVAVTGVASGGLGTAANLEDTQLWSLDDLQVPEDGAIAEPEVVAEPAPVRAPAVDRPRANHDRVERLAYAQPAERVEPSKPLPAPVLPPPRGKRRTGVIAAAAIGLIALAALLAFRDGFPGGATGGSGDAAGAFPSLPPGASSGPLVTTAPDAGGGGGGKKNGNGNGKGNGNH